jgi:hypothetical protein
LNKNDNFSDIIFIFTLAIFCIISFSGLLFCMFYPLNVSLFLESIHIIVYLYICNIVQLNSFYVKFESKHFFIYVINTITNWHISLSYNVTHDQITVKFTHELQTFVIWSFVTYFWKWNSSISYSIIIYIEIHHPIHTCSSIKGVCYTYSVLDIICLLKFEYITVYIFYNVVVIQLHSRVSVLLAYLTNYKAYN